MNVDTFILVTPVATDLCRLQRRARESGTSSFRERGNVRDPSRTISCRDTVTNTTVKPFI